MDLRQGSWHPPTSFLARGGVRQRKNALGKYLRAGGTYLQNLHTSWSPLPNFQLLQVAKTRKCFPVEGYVVITLPASGKAEHKTTGHATLSGNPSLRAEAGLRRRPPPDLFLEIGHGTEDRQRRLATAADLLALSLHRSQHHLFTAPQGPPSQDAKLH